MQWIDQNTWPRAEHFALFSGVSNPFYSTTFRVDVTNLYDYTKARGISFYYSLTYLVTQAINRVENFLYVLEEGKVGLLERRIPSFTDMKKAVICFISSLWPVKVLWRNFAMLQEKKAWPKLDCWIRARKQTS